MTNEVAKIDLLNEANEVNTNHSNYNSLEKETMPLVMALSLTMTSWSEIHHRKHLLLTPMQTLLFILSLSDTTLSHHKFKSQCLTKSV